MKTTTIALALLATLALVSPSFALSQGCESGSTHSAHSGHSTSSAKSPKSPHSPHSPKSGGEQILQAR